MGFFNLNKKTMAKKEDISSFSLAKIQYLRELTKLSNILAKMYETIFITSL